MKLIVTALMGTESLIGAEMRLLGYAPERIAVKNASVELDAGDAYAEAAARLNLWTRCGERVLLKLAEAAAPDFDSLFDTVHGLPWEEWISRGSVIRVDGYTRRSRLTSIPACQSIIKKAIVRRLLEVRGAPSSGRIEENPAKGTVRIRFGILKDRVTVMADTSGNGLHKRGYRPLRSAAPLRETLAAAMVQLSRWNPEDGENLLDPFCGSGTIPIEAALLAANRAPGRNRRFAGEHWFVIGPRAFDRARQEADDLVVAPNAGVFGSDLDEAQISLAKGNAQRAGVADDIRFAAADAQTLNAEEREKITGPGRTLIVCNPPYGERLLTPEDARAIQQDMARVFLPGGSLDDGLRLSVLSPDDDFEQTVGATADKRRKLYNGMIKCTMYHYFRHARKQG